MCELSRQRVGRCRGCGHSLAHPPLDRACAPQAVRASIILNDIILKRNICSGAMASIIMLRKISNPSLMFFGSFDQVNVRRAASLRYLSLACMAHEIHMCCGGHPIKSATRGATQNISLLLTRKKSILGVTQIVFVMVSDAATESWKKIWYKHSSRRKARSGCFEVAHQGPRRQLGWFSKIWRCGGSGAHGR